jgi:hypothetical protein
MVAALMSSFVIKGTRDIEAWYYASQIKRKTPQFEHRFRHLHTRSLVPFVTSTNFWWNSKAQIQPKSDPFHTGLKASVLESVTKGVA